MWIIQIGMRVITHPTPDIEAFKVTSENFLLKAVRVTIGHLSKPGKRSEAYPAIFLGFGLVIVFPQFDCTGKMWDLLTAMIFRSE
jgi:hypothetical protein